MSYSHYERLSSLDATFFEIEDENSPMHVGAVAVFEPGPLTLPEGGFDIDRFRTFVESVLEARYRQRIERMPITGDPIWVDDPHFNLLYHVRHLALPHPGDERLLKRLAGHVMSLPLDRHKPLWELWVIEGLQEGGFALITKAHHCMVDGVGSVDLLSGSMQIERDATVREPRPWIPRPAPSARDVVLGELSRRVGKGIEAASSLGGALRHPGDALGSFRDALGGIGEALGASMHQTSPTPLNIEIGPHRRFDWLRYDLNDVKAVKNALGGTVNDVVLANVSGALRHFLAGRGENVSALDFRVMIPVNVRTEKERGEFGNRVTTFTVPLPLGEPSARGRLERIVETTHELKESRQSQGIEAMEEIGEFGLTGIITRLSRLAALSRPFNLVVTNVPGPQIQAYLLGSALRAAYPLVPLFRNQALGIALLSYNGSVFWGLNSDWDAIPDLHQLAESLAVDFENLRKEAQA
jgi:WS/DGAT/MGAT family acyltransferase